VNCPRDGLLARARFADDQDRKAVSGGLRGNCEGGAKFRSRADQLLERKLGRELLRYRSELAGCPSPVGIGCERFQQPLRSDRPDEEIARPGAHRFHRHRDRVAVAENDQGKFLTLFAKRRAGSFSRQRCTIAPSRAGNAGFAESHGAGVEWRIAASVET